MELCQLSQCIPVQWFPLRCRTEEDSLHHRHYIHTLHWHVVHPTTKNTANTTKYLCVIVMPTIFSFIFFKAVMSHFCKPKKNMNFINFVKVVFMVCQHAESTRPATTLFNRTACVSFLNPIQTGRKMEHLMNGQCDESPLSPSEQPHLAASAGSTGWRLWTRSWAGSVPGGCRRATPLSESEAGTGKTLLTKCSPAS